MSDTILIIVLAVIGIGIGFFIGMLVSSLRNLNRDKTFGDRLSHLKVGDGHAEHQGEINPSLLVDKDLPDIDSDAVDMAPNKKRMQLNPFDALARVFQPDMDSPDPYDRSISEQIDEILQEMLENSQLKLRGIRLMELPERGMVVMVGLDQYEGVEAIPDENIRNLIHAAVAEWERRTTVNELDKEMTET